MKLSKALQFYFGPTKHFVKVDTLHKKIWFEVKKFIYAVPKILPSSRFAKVSLTMYTSFNNYYSW